MKILSALLALAALAAASARDDAHRSSRAAALEPLHRFELTTHAAAGAQAPSRAREAASSGAAPHGAAINLKFSAFGNEYDLDLGLHADLVSEGARVVVRGADGAVEQDRPARLLAYAGRLESGGWVRATVTADGEVHTVFHENDDLHFVEPASAHDLAEHTARHVAEHGVSHVAYRHADAALQGDAYAWVRAMLPPSPAIQRSEQEAPAPAATTHLRKALAAWDTYDESAYIDYNGAYGLLSGCPSSLYVAEYGFAHDIGYSRKVSDSTTVDVDLVEATTQMMMNIINMLYTDQVNLFIKIAEFDVRTSTGGDDWNQEPQDYDFDGSEKDTLGCPVASDTSALLGYFSTWYQSKSPPAKYDGWHQLTHCFPSPGTVGLAYVSATGSSSWATGWTSWSANTFETLAHELGHNIGASHGTDTSGNIITTDGGLMSYDSSAEFYFKAEITNPSDVCGHISSITSSDLSLASATCGNYIVEPGEDCDDDSSCCSSCAFASGAQCTPYGTECCQDDCLFAPTTTMCNGGNGFCANGFCTGGFYCGYYSNTECCENTANACSENYYINGGSTCYSAGSSAYIPAGTVCNTDNYAECDGSGNCVETTGPEVASISVTSPASGDTWVHGATETVSWTSSGAGSTVSVTLSDGTALSSSTSNDGSLTVTVPTVAEGSYTVTVSDGSVSGASASFSVEQQPELTLTTDLGGSTLTLGDSVTFEWVVGGSPSEVNVLLYQGTSYVATLAAGLAGSATSLSWTVAGVDAGDNYNVVVDDGADASDTGATFSVVEANSLSVSTPGGWQAGQQYTVSFSYTGSVSSVNVYLISSDTGAETLYGTVSASAQLLQFTLSADTAEGTYYVRVEDAANPDSVFAESGTFQVTEAAVALEVTSPAAGDVWVVGETYTVVWNGADTYSVDLFDADDVVAHEFSAGAAGGGLSVTLPDTLTAGDGFYFKLGNTADVSDVAYSGAFTVEDAVAITSVDTDAAAWAHGETYTISWVTTGSTSAASTVDVTLHRGSDGALADTVSEGMLDVGYFSYTVPDELDAGTYFVTVASNTYEGVSGVSDSVSVAGVVTITHPSAGETLYNGATATLEWTDTAGDAPYTVECTQDGTQVFSTSTNFLSLSWTIDVDAASNNFELSVTSSGGVSDSVVFAVEEQASVTVTSPDGDAWTQGESQTVTWTTTGDIASVSIDIVDSAGASALSTEVANSGSYALVVPSTMAVGQCSVSVQSTVASQIDDTWNAGDPWRAYATVSAPEVTTDDSGAVVAPATGDSVTQGDSVTVAWEGFAASDAVAIEVRAAQSNTDNTLLATLATDASNANAFEWAVDADFPVGSNRFVRVTSSQGTVADSGYFSTVAQQPGITVTEIFEGQNGQHWNRAAYATVEFEVQGAVDAVDVALYSGSDVVLTLGTGITESPFQWYVPAMAPPSIDDSYHVRVSSSDDPSVYDVFASEFVLVDADSADNGDSLGEHVEVIFPDSSAEIVMGSSVTVTWSSAGVGHVNIYLYSAGAVVGSALATGIESTGAFVWAVSTELYEAPVYSIYIESVETPESANYETAQFSIVADAASAPAIVFDAPRSSAEWTVDTEVTVEWEGAYLALPLTLSANDVVVATDLPTSGSLSFTLTAAMAGDPASTGDMHVTLASDEVSKDSASFAVGVYPSVNFTAPTGQPQWAKGSSHYVRWDYSGFDFYVEGHLFQGSPERRSVQGNPCVDWVDPVDGSAHSGCEPDAADPSEEVCAVSVTSEGYIDQDEVCASLASHHVMVIEDVVATRASKGKYYLSVPYDRDDVPSPGVDYTLQLVNTDTGDVFYSGFFDVAYAPARLYFQMSLGVDDWTTATQSDLISALAALLGIDEDRIEVEEVFVWGSSADDDDDGTDDAVAARRRLADGEYSEVQVLIDSTTNPDDDAAVDVGASFAALVEDDTSDLWSDPLLSTVDATVGVTVEEVDTSEPSEEEDSDDGDDWTLYAIGAGAGVGAIVVVAGAAVAIHKCRSRSQEATPLRAAGPGATPNPMVSAPPAAVVSPAFSSAPAMGGPAAPPPVAGGKPLPPGWYSAVSNEGETYYFNATTGVTQWTRPQ